MNRHIENLVKIFHSCLKSVQPLVLIENSIKIESSSNGIHLKINQDEFNFGQNHNFHIIGFGKAVLGMALKLESLLGSNLKSGILSIPTGTMEKYCNENQLNKTILKIYEGAVNNIPDENSFKTAIKIKKLASEMNSNDTVFVLVSGGGSALLPLPKHPLTLKEKQRIILKLQNNGASIEELNIVRISLSEIKGGKLYKLANNACKVISLVISDIVKDPVHLIASGPTVPKILNTNFLDSKNILEKYKIWDMLIPEVKQVIENDKRNLDDQSEQSPSNNYIYIIGSNKVAVKECFNKAKELNYFPIILSIEIEGNIQHLCETYINFLRNLKRYQSDSKTEELFAKNFPFYEMSFKEFVQKISQAKADQLPIVFILAGEPTVLIKGKGKGGRSQELALKLAIEFDKYRELNNSVFLAAGTDGIDGPTDAAGALGSSAIIQNYLNLNKLMDLEEILNNNDSYNFFKNLDNGRYHIKTGHTGTNVMDIHLIVP